PGTHLGMLTGARARTTSWAELAAFLENPHGDVPSPGDTAPADAADAAPADA
nr:hypothetical protein [Rhodococcus sp. (in: high G+C Gram-positive bacteria)]